MQISEVIKNIQSQWQMGIIEEINFHGETTLQVNKKNLIDILTFLKGTPEPGFTVLTDLTGVDYLFPEPFTKVVYWLQNPESYQRLRLTVLVKRNELLPSVTPLWQGANWYERELYDLFGVLFDDHPDLKRILMPDDWIGHPLRRDYALTEESVQFKNDVKPKVPSEIIPYVKKARY